MPTLKEMNRHMWGCGRRPHPHICLLFFLRWPFSAACQRVLEGVSAFGSLGSPFRKSLWGGSFWSSVVVSSGPMARPTAARRNRG